MNTNILQSPKEIKEALPLTKDAETTVLESRRHITNILKGEDKRLLIILGPCSIDSKEAALEYANKIKELQEKLKDKIYLVMRTYFEKPRTTIGWKGLLYDPNQDNSHKIKEGIQESRKLLIEINKLGVGCATEFVSPFTQYFLGDCIAYGTIGARTAESQIHRESASSLEMPTGFKNTTEGNIEIAINAMLSARHQHTYLGINEDNQISVITSTGNYNTHVILRGGNKGPNYDPETVQKTINTLKEHNLTQRIIIDCSHANSNKRHEKQPKIALNIMEQKKENPFIAGIMLESYLLSGCGKGFGQSRTDGCIDWATTEATIQRVYSLL